MRTHCQRCNRFSYGFPLCSWCRRKANDGRKEDGRIVKWNPKRKVFEVGE